MIDRQKMKDEEVGATNIAGDWADTLAEKILGAHCSCYAEAWPAHTCANEVAEVATLIRSSFSSWGLPSFDPPTCLSLLDRLDRVESLLKRAVEALNTLAARPSNSPRKAIIAVNPCTGTREALTPLEIAESAARAITTEIKETLNDRS